MIEHPTQNKGMISPLTEQEKKRPRRSDGGEDMNAEIALSIEESGRAQ